jgi:GDP-L-fucose synthase
MPTNLYGPNDNFNLETSHVLPAMIRKFHEAKVQGKDSVIIWGTGKPLREFMYVEDLANAIVFMMENIQAKDLYEKGITHLNVGSGKDITIADLAKLISEIIGFEGKIEYDSSKPDGTPRKLMDVTRINSLGWQYKTELSDGIAKTYEWFLEKYK